MDDIGKNIDPIKISAHEEMDCKRVFTRKNIPAPDVEEAWRNFSSDNKLNPGVSNHRSKNILFLGFIAGVAASVVILMGIYQLFIVPAESGSMQVFTSESGEDGVSLTDASGHSLNLSNDSDDNKALLSQGVKANKDSLVYASSVVDARPNMMTISTSRGKEYYVVLPDGTKVWLNADSKLVFPDHFVGDKRIVHLEGEAYFEVQQDKERPFIITSKHFSTQVLGTKFDMKVYDAANANVVLLEGKVALESGDGKAIQTIVPGQKAVFTEEGTFAVQEVDTYAYVQWKNGYFYFNNVPLVEIMKELGRWYNVDIIIENSRKMQTRFHFVAERNQDLAAALNNLNAIGDVYATMVDGKIIVK